MIVISFKPILLVTRRQLKCIRVVQNRKMIEQLQNLQNEFVKLHTYLKYILNKIDLYLNSQRPTYCCLPIFLCHLKIRLQCPIHLLRRELYFGSKHISSPCFLDASPLGQLAYTYFE